MLWSGKLDILYTWLLVGLGWTWLLSWTLVPGLDMASIVADAARVLNMLGA